MSCAFSQTYIFKMAIKYNSDLIVKIVVFVSYNYGYKVYRFLFVNTGNFPCPSE